MAGGPEKYEVFRTGLCLSCFLFSGSQRSDFRTFEQRKADEDANTAGTSAE
jgi:hypothetical protein